MNLKEIGKVVRSAREIRNLKISDIESKSGIHEHTIRRIETGRASRTESVIALAESLGFTLTLIANSESEGSLDNFVYRDDKICNLENEISRLKSRLFNIKYELDRIN